MHAERTDCGVDHVVPSPLQIKRSMDKLVDGHDDAKRYLAAIAYKHLILTSSHGDGGSRSHTLILGPTGSGKSLLINGLAQALGRPFVSVDATSLTEVGYHGRDVDSIFEELLRQTSGDQEAAERGIVFLDEFDKLRSSNGSERDIRGRGVQHSLLKILDGDIRSVRGARPSRASAVAATDMLSFRTGGLLFVMAGAFVDMDGRAHSAISHLDLAASGFIPELLGRIPNLVQLPKVDECNMAEAIRAGTRGIMREYGDLFKAMGCTMELTENAIRRISIEAAQYGLGYRGIRIVIDRVLMPKLHELWEMSPIQPTQRVELDFRSGEFVVDAF